MNESVIGRCSLCGGDLVQYTGPWMSVGPPPEPRCRACGAVRANDGPVIPMKPGPARTTAPESLGRAPDGSPRWTTWN